MHRMIKIYFKRYLKPIKWLNRCKSIISFRGNFLFNFNKFLRQSMTYFKYFLKNSFKIIYLYGPREAIIFFKSFFQYKKEIDSKIAIIKSDFEITNPGENFNKYLDTNYWVFENLKRIYLLNLHKKNTQSTLC